MRHLLRGQAGLAPEDLDKVVRATKGFSASDLTALCKEAAMGPIRELGPAIAKVQASSIRSIALADFGAALGVIKPSVNREALAAFDEWTREFGTQ
ncbi:hypothetical protein FOA52_009025 [Chlamydomonas sp. UWO 241]|nr:hypothetical protein FOA52_009025 [Chlamydomonas sp. UWO 241]